MAENTAQTYANHTRYDPLFHFFAIPVFAIGVGVSAWSLFRSGFTFGAIWSLVVSAALVVSVFRIRQYALRVQDRLIRLEERLRFATALPDPLRSRIGELSEGQFVALRFASDEELPRLVEKALAANLPGGEIKKLIVNWRPDYFRV